MTIIDGENYRSASPSKRRTLIPEAPGVYVWTMQLGRLGDGLVAGEQLTTSVRDSFAHVRGLFFDHGRAGRYRRVHVYDDPPALTAAAAAKFDDLVTLGHDDLSWVLALGTVFQRPLYVGKAIDLRSRLKDHFSYRTTFSKGLEPFGLNFNQVAVIALPVGGTEMQSLDGTDEPSSEDQGLDDMQDNASDLAATSMLAGTGEDVELDEELEDSVLGTDSPERQRDKLLISLAESLLIRNLQPMFNKKVD